MKITHHNHVNMKVGIFSQWKKQSHIFLKSETDSHYKIEYFKIMMH